MDKRELDLARSLIDRFTGEFEAARYADTYRERMLEVIESKGRAETIETPQTEERVEAPDLLAALRESVERAKRGDGRRHRDRDGSELDELTVGELSKRASKLGIEGRVEDVQARDRVRDREARIGGLTSGPPRCADDTPSQTAGVHAAGTAG